MLENTIKRFSFCNISSDTTSKTSNSTRSHIHSNTNDSIKNKLVFCPVGDIQEKDFPVRRGDHISLATYYRLFLPSLLPQDIKRVLYLDGDILCATSLKDFYSTDMTDISACVVYDFGTNKEKHIARLKKLKCKLDTIYFNSGVLLINLEYWREYDIQKKSIDFLQKNADACKWHDQDVLNAVLEGKVKYLPIKYNASSSLFSILLNDGTTNNRVQSDCSCATQKEQQEAVLHPVIIHFDSVKKPWVLQSRHALTCIWLLLYKITFGKNCKQKNIYKGKTLFLYKIKHLLHKLGIKHYKEFSIPHRYDDLIKQLTSIYLQDTHCQ